MVTHLYSEQNLRIGQWVQKTQLVYLIPVVMVLSLPVWLMPAHVVFRDIGITKIVELLTLLLFVALFLERTLEVFILTLRGPEEAKLENELDKRKNGQSEPKNIESNKALEQAQLKKIEYKSQTQRIALWVGLILGLLISAVGIQALQTLVDINALNNLPKLQLTAFRLMDVLLTGSIIAGGSEGIHRLIKVYNSFMGAAANAANAANTANRPKNE